MVAIVDKESCVGCEGCVDSCPSGAISIKDEKATVDKDKCVDCNTCVDSCPTTSIKIE